MQFQEMVANAEANRESLDEALKGCARETFVGVLIGAMLNYVNPEDFKSCLETAMKVSRVSEDIHGVENI